MAVGKPDFEGWVTKYGIRCSDGRTIKHGAFQNEDSTRVPLVWEHQKDSVTNILGSVELTHKSEGVWGKAYFNGSSNAKHAKEAVVNGDITSMSVHAKNVMESGGLVSSAKIHEVSLVLAGANPGAKIDVLTISHSSDSDAEVEVIVHGMSELEHSDPLVEEYDDSGDEVEDMDALKEYIVTESDYDYDYDESSEGDPEDSDLTDEDDDPEDSEDSDLTDEEEGDLSEDLSHSDDDDDRTIKDIYDSMSDKEKTVLHYLIVQAAGVDEEDDVQHSDANSQNNQSTPSGETVKDIYDAMSDDKKFVVDFIVGSVDKVLEDQNNQPESEGADMAHSNVFEQNAPSSDIVFSNEVRSFTHSDLADLASEIFENARDGNIRLSDSIRHSQKTYGIVDPSVLFPDPKDLGKVSWIKKDEPWVESILGKATHTPFARLRTTQLDLSEGKMRAKGYITGKEKKEGVMKALSRTTNPQTIYVKSKLDRDDILDAEEHDIVSYTREALRYMLREEVARAVLIGDGRESTDPDKIKEECVRPIWTDDKLYAPKHLIKKDFTAADLMDQIVMAQEKWKGSGTPTLFASYKTVMSMLLLKKTGDSNERIHRSKAELADALMVSDIQVVAEMDNKTRTDSGNTLKLQCIIANMSDYTIGHPKGGDVFEADAFDIDFNQHKYLTETRMSGALTEPKTAVVIESVESGSVPGVTD